MFRNVLVPMDLSDRSLAAVRAAAELCVRGETSLTLLHVIETLQDVEDEEVEAFYARLRERAEKVLEARAADLSREGLEVRREIAFGRRGSEILRLAEELGSDLIVLCSHALEPRREGAGFGTISHQVALLARCAVLLLREEQQNLSR